MQRGCPQDGEDADPRAQPTSRNHEAGEHRGQPHEPADRERQSREEAVAAVGPRRIERTLQLGDPLAPEGDPHERQGHQHDRDRHGRPQAAAAGRLLASPTQAWGIDTFIAGMNVASVPLLIGSGAVATSSSRGRHGPGARVPEDHHERGEHEDLHVPAVEGLGEGRPCEDEGHGRPGHAQPASCEDRTRYTRRDPGDCRDLAGQKGKGREEGQRRGRVQERQGVPGGLVERGTPGMETRRPASARLRAGGSPGPRAAGTRGRGAEGPRRSR